MKHSIKIVAVVAAALVTLGSGRALAQPSPSAAVRPGPAGTVSRGGQDVPGTSNELTKFDLNFPGGTPKALVAAIEKALGKPLNAIIPDEYADTKLPALRMKSVDVSQLFLALQAATTKTVMYVTSGFRGGPSGGPGGYKSYSTFQTSCGFKSVSKPTDDTIWYFYVDRPALPEGSAIEDGAKGAKVCRFYSLAPYLERHISVDDITTAVETGWKMLGEASPAAIKFHKDTGLLIAVGKPSALETIDAVLKALDEPRPGGFARRAGPAARPAEKPGVPEEK